MPFQLIEEAVHELPSQRSCLNAIIFLKAAELGGRLPFKWNGTCGLKYFDLFEWAFNLTGHMQTYFVQCETVPEPGSNALVSCCAGVETIQATESWGPRVSIFAVLVALSILTLNWIFVKWHFRRLPDHRTKYPDPLDGVILRWYWRLQVCIVLCLIICNYLLQSGIWNSLSKHPQTFMRGMTHYIDPGVCPFGCEWIRPHLHQRVRMYIRDCSEWHLGWVAGW